MTWGIVMYLNLQKKFFSHWLMSPDELNRELRIVYHST